jgi:DNA polymerase-3 subunit delta
MTALKAHEVARFVARPDPEARIILAYGPDAGLVRETAQRLAQHYAGNDADALVVLEGAELDADPSRLAVEVNTPSLFSSRRVIRVRNAGKALVQPVASLADDPGDTVVVLEGGNLAPRDPLRALVEGARPGRALPCYPDTEETLLKLIADTFSKAGIRADAEVAPTLRDILGNDREVTRRELEKLVLFAERSKTLTREDVIALCADNAALAMDQILDAAGTGHAARLEAALDRALAAAVSPQQILSITLGHFAQLRRWRTAVDGGGSAREVIESARPRPHFSRKVMLEQQLRLWTDDALAAAATRLQLATADSRKRYAMTETVVRRALLAVATMAAEH